MMNRYLILFFFTFCISHLQAQEVKVKAGPPYRVIDASHKLYFHERGEVMTVKVADRLIYIQRFDANMKFKTQREYKDLPKNAAIERIAEHNGSYYLFYSLWNRSRAEEELYYREIHFSDGTMDKEAKKLLSAKGKISGTAVGHGFRLIVQNKFDFLYSHDQAKLLIQYRKVPEFKSDKKSHDIIGMHVFGRYFDPIWNREVEMPYTEKMMNNLDYSVDTDGNAYVLAMVYNDKTTDSKWSNEGSPNYHVELLSTNGKSKEIKTTSVTLQDKFINSLSLFESSPDYMICAGFYNDGKRVRDTDGIFACKINKAGEVYDKSTIEVPLELINQNASKRAVRKNTIKETEKEDETAVIPNLYFDYANAQADGSIVLVGEQFDIKTYTSYVNGRSSSRTVLNYGDIMVVKISPEGKLGWIKKVPKRQAGTNQVGSMSYSYFHGGTNHHFIFLDTDANKDLTDDKVPAVSGNGGTGLFTDYVIDDTTGEMKRLNLFHTDNADNLRAYQLTPTRAVQTADNEFIVEVYKKKKEDVLLKVEIK
ncbi:hypothetical protein [Fulvivirga ligni]|uniref:hypothetical protein n=1 Tax=Fulvivirga ligni TaxID=2904246 RepID=UPI001F340E1D|nr:hypothetical protein [Fulvivirga ligni]UII19459.1 hypothetical protein LVD16_16590 [Fulvivirga ligni]